MRNQFHFIVAVFLWLLRFVKYIFLFGNKHLPKQTTIPGSRVHVLGNGPGVGDSVKRFYKSDDDIVMVNYAYKTDLFFELKPKYLVMIDPGFFDNNFDYKTLEENMSKINWTLTLVTASHFCRRALIAKLIKHEYIKIKFIRTVPYTYADGFSKFMSYLYKHNLAVSYFINVIEAAIYTAINEGYQTVYMHGVCANSVKDTKINASNEIIREDIHYYGKEIRNLTKEGVCALGRFYFIITCWRNFLKGAYLLEKYASEKKVSVYNCCEESMIDSFKRL